MARAELLQTSDKPLTAFLLVFPQTLWRTYTFCHMEGAFYEYKFWLIAAVLSGKWAILYIFLLWCWPCHPLVPFSSSFC